MPLEIGGSTAAVSAALIAHAWGKRFGQAGTACESEHGQQLLAEAWQPLPAAGQQNSHSTACMPCSFPAFLSPFSHPLFYSCRYADVWHIITLT